MLTVSGLKMKHSGSIVVFSLMADGMNLYPHDSERWQGFQLKGNKEFYMIFINEHENFTTYICEGISLKLHNFCCY